MLNEYKNKTNIGIGVGWILSAIGNSLLTDENLFGLLLVITGLVLFIWGCSQYAKGKGQSKWYGLLGFFNLLGLLILVLLKDKHKKPKAN